MSARATFWAWEVEVPSSEKLVLLCLSDCHNADTGQCNPSVSYISKKTSLDRKTVLKSLRSLNDREILSRAKVEGSSNQYFLSIGGSPILGHGQAHISPEPVPNATFSGETPFSSAINFISCLLLRPSYLFAKFIALLIALSATLDGP